MHKKSAIEYILYKYEWETDSRSISSICPVATCSSLPTANSPFPCLLGFACVAIPLALRRLCKADTAKVELNWRSVSFPEGK